MEADQFSVMVPRPGVAVRSVGVVGASFTEMIVMETVAVVVARPSETE